MGGCCCSSRKSHLVGTPPLYYYCPESFEELGPSGARAGVGSAALTTGLLVDTRLETSIPDTFFTPTPLPYDLLLGRPDSESIKGKIKESSFEKVASCEEDLGGLDCKTQHSSVLILSPSESDLSKQKTRNQLVDEEEDSCPICFEEYDVENPKIKTKCEHGFHLPCILEWVERSGSCPICDKEITFDDCFN